MTNIKSYIFQFTSVLFSFLNVKLFLDFLGDDDYATWMVVFSIAGLIYAIDFGIGSSVRNQLARLMAKRANPKALARLVFAYYKLIIIIAFTLGFAAIGIGLLAHKFGWLDSLGTHLIVALTILIFSDFVARAHHPVFAALQQPQSTNLALAGIQLLNFMSLYLVLMPNKEVIGGKILAIAVVVFGGSILINTLMFLRLNSLMPLFVTAFSTSSLTMRMRQGVNHLKRGFPFFLLQINFAILSQIAFYFIYANFPNGLVVEMSIADKVFAPFIIFATIIMYPFWSAYTLLIHRGESDRVRTFLRRQEYISLICIPFLFIGILFYDEIVFIWLNRKNETSIFAFFAALKVFSIFINSIYSYFMNACGKLLPQLYAYGIGLIVAFPILYFSSLHQNIYFCLSITPAILLVSAIVQRHFVFNVILIKNS